ncbi:MAG: NAD(P)/FAD-dependent oxidoreductase [Chitinophaga sp.]|uniref:NAD(P)/FAD-dependent oxidoreductase n=1 Tax=Chitinophaga sp. TaxID=1869181 RepID=UPI001B265E16|nr:NAD(P)/FAD-dependent oxidoreductase [Chitinophaga sp.]MBO9728826.1 NAD(P)/FAD-dependent oxidoreductase [Chitinophaga sp.]
MQSYDVIITGGSYAGLSAAMALGRSLRKVLVLDSGAPCNQQTPHSHNFLTQDGARPADIAAKAKEQVAQYPEVHFRNELAVSAEKNATGFLLRTAAGNTFQARLLLFATGVKDEMPAIKGFAESWGISVLHCPYCHGYEVKQAPTGILANGDIAFDFARLIHNWTQQLTVFTHGTSQLSAEQTAKLAGHGITVNEQLVEEIVAVNGQVTHLLLKDGSTHPVAALYSRPPFRQHCAIPEALGCNLTEMGHLSVDHFQATNIPGVYAAGDATSPMRSVAAAVAAGNMAGAAMNRELILADF